jgi:hypothetical protein
LAAAAAAAVAAAAAAAAVADVELMVAMATIKAVPPVCVGGELQVRSDSDHSDRYTVTNVDGTLFCCDCPDFRFRAARGADPARVSCKHITVLLGGAAADAERQRRLRPTFAADLARARNEGAWGGGGGVAGGGGGGVGLQPAAGVLLGTPLPK